MLPNASRYRLLLVDYGRIILISLILISLIGFAVAGWLAATPKTAEVSQTVYSDTVTTTTTDSVVLTNDTVLYERGTRLQDKPIYLRRWSEDVQVTIQTALPSTRTATVSHAVSVTYQVTANGGTVYSERQRLMRTSTRVTNGTAVSTLLLNISAIQDPKNRLAREFGSVGSISMTLHVNATYSTDQYAGSFEEPLPLSIQSDFYSVGTISQSRKHTETTAQTVTRSRPLSIYLLPGGGGALALGLAALIGVRYYRDLDQGRAIDRAALIDDIHHERHAEWISEGDVNTEQDVDVTVDSLEDLVDVAIDVNQRVIYDSSKDIYYILNNERTYQYIPSSNTH